MPKLRKSKPAADVQALVRDAEAALQADKSLRRSAVGPAPVREQVLASLQSRGYELTKSVVRVPLAEQLRALLDDGAFIDMKEIGSYVRGGSVAAARHAAQALLQRGQALHVMRGASETLVPPSTDVLAGEALASSAKRVAALGKLLQGAVRKGKAVGVLRTDVQYALDEMLPTARPSPVSRQSATTPEISRVLRAVDSTRDPSVGLSFVPRIVHALSDLDPPVVKKALLEAASRGLIELRPEGGIGRLSETEWQMCPEGPHGTRLSWARRLEVQA